MRKSKNRYFYHIFVSPGDAPEAIKLNVVWMEREFDAYKLSRWCAHLTITVSQIERDIGRKLSFFQPPLHSTPSLGGFPSEYHHTVWCGKTRMVWLPDGKKIRRYLYSFWRNSRTWLTDGQADRHRMPAIAALMHSIERQKSDSNFAKVMLKWKGSSFFDSQCSTSVVVLFLAQNIELKFFSNKNCFI